ncbi:MAG TPA: aminotransferase class IV [Chryseolinea sp.]|nr:aminotransferase class IV [Chryseolinea sp.]
MNSASFAFVRGEIIPHEKAFLHISDLSIQRGYGVFDFFKVSDEHPFFLNDYLDRFYHSATVMRLGVPYVRRDLRVIINQLIKQNDLRESGVKMILTGGYSRDGYQPGESNLIITQQPLILPVSDVIDKGIKVITYEYMRDFALAKTINYTMGIWLSKLVADNNASDVLYYKNGTVSEFPRCNFFIVRKDGTIVTPAENVLLGVTRMQVLDIASKHYRCETAAVTLADLRSAKEAFLTSTTKRIVPIVQIDDFSIGNGKPGPVTISLLDHLIDLEKADRERQ